MKLKNHPLYKEDIQAIVQDKDLPWEKLYEKSVLITGATGMIGSCVVDVLLAANKTLDAKIHVYAMGRSAERARKRFEEDWTDAQFTFIEQDVSCPWQWEEKVDYILHAASNADPRSFAQYPVDTICANFLGMQHALELARRQKSQRVLFVSSGEMYGQPTEALDGFTEAYCGPVDYAGARACYPAGKRAAEVLCHCYESQYGVESVIARPCHIYGPTMTKTDSRAVAQFIRNAVAGEEIVLKSEGLQERSLCYVTDTASAVLYILLKGQSGQAYNIADPEIVLSVRQLAEAIAAAGKTNVVFDLPDEVEKAGYTRVTRAVLRAEKLLGLGWKAKVPLEKGLGKTILICRAAAGLENE